MKETVVYLIRHSEVLGTSNYNVEETEQITNEKRILSVRGESIAKEVSDNSELHGLDILYTSQYVRAMSSAKYIALNNNLEMICDSRLGERRLGHKGNMEWRDFERMQFKDFDYKLYGGESINQVNKRTTEFLKEVLIKDEGKRIAIVTHGTAIVSLFINWCEKGYNFDGNLILDLKGENVYDGDIKPMQIYKLKFDNLKLLSIERI